MYLLKTVGEFGYLCVKDPLVDWADEVAINWMDMPLDEASATLFAQLMSYMPERTRMAFNRLGG
jgi:hypothetical protein